MSTRPQWYEKFVVAWRKDRLTPFGPMTRLESCYLEAHWQLHCAHMPDIDTQLENFARNVTGILPDASIDVRSDQGLGNETQA